jgi:hypothetical protein
MIKVHSLRGKDLTISIQNEENVIIDKK